MARGIWLWLGVVTAVGCLWTSSADAEPTAGEREAARQLGAQGTKAFQAGDYRVAADKLAQAYAVVPAPSLGLWRARALVQLGQWLAASEQYLTVTRLEVKSGNLALQRQSQADALAERNALLPRIPTIVIELQGATPDDVTLSVDGNAISSGMVGVTLPVDPGRHEAIGVRGETRVRADVEVKEGESKVVRLSFPKEAAVIPPVVDAPGAPLPAREPERPATPTPAAVVATPVTPAVSDSPRAPLTKTLGWVSLAAGGVGLGTGIATGIVVLGKKSALKDSAECEAPLRCLPTKQDEVSSYNSLRTVSTVSFIAGGALLGLGVGLLLVTPSTPQQTASLRLDVGPTSLAARGEF